MTTAVLRKPSRNVDKELQEHDIASFLGERVVLLSTRFGWWKGIYQLPSERAKVQVDGIEVDDNRVTAPRIKLMTKKFPLDRSGEPWQQRFTTLQSRVGSLKNRLSVSFSVPGVRLVPIKAAKEFMEELIGPTVSSLQKKELALRQSGNFHEATLVAEELRSYAGTHKSTPIYNSRVERQSIAYDLRRMSAEFCDDYDNIVEQIRRNVPEFEMVAQRIPTSATAMARRFFLGVSPVLLDSGQQKTLTTSDLVEHEETVRETCRQYAQDAIAEMISEPRMQLAQALAGLRDLIKRDGRITSASFNQVREAMRKIELFECVSTPELVAQIQALKEKLPDSVGDFRAADRAARDGFAAAIEAIENEVADAHKMAEAASMLIGDDIDLEL